MFLCEDSYKLDLAKLSIVINCHLMNQNENSMRELSHSTVDVALDMPFYT